jgi:hypothetical protein
VSVTAQVVKTCPGDTEPTTWAQIKVPGGLAGWAMIGQGNESSIQPCAERMPGAFTVPAPLCGFLPRATFERRQ